MKLRGQKLWVVVTPEGYLLLATPRTLRHECLATICKLSGEPWKDLYRKGYRCIRVTVTQDKKGVK